ncbi:HD domain-containing protein [Noviherbaspirillum saxi]|uniref:Bifunctional (P)ppGpp synthetase/guanosine-3',5'-bis(Diphosphate) 3'-pyrophosphohydrolase n=1 Tax=Noviherbaspirillum saxi TaxID=2320863 RepID=A0A3A3FTY7_9BURK|nr:HD domain-containing protein [Noviherbaspirillum saxi]RJF99000.1 bifunctional (p)ppGpp synthetase/guanosine-3',5'-bis(diphosphate) 3'-pyrophosphohydrolase [Noviherbaspirillum saxi]
MHADIAFSAMLFAREVHKNQVRRYTGNPYSDHLAEVAGIVATAAHAYPHHMRDQMIAVAWLHDCVEDQGVQHHTLIEKFGMPIADGVRWLSDLEKGNRQERKAASRARLARAPDWVQTIKCADLISNTSSIVKHDPTFAVTYLQEKRELLAVLTNVDMGLWHLAAAQANVQAISKRERERENDRKSATKDMALLRLP